MSVIKEIYIGRKLFVNPQDVYVKNCSSSSAVSSCQIVQKIAPHWDRDLEDYILTISFKREGGSDKEIYYNLRDNKFCKFSTKGEQTPIIVEFDEKTYKERKLREECESLKKRIKAQQEDILACWEKIRNINIELYN